MSAILTRTCLAALALGAFSILPAAASPGTAPALSAATGNSALVRVSDRDDRWERRHHRRHHRHHHRRHRHHVVDAPFTHVESGRHTYVDAPFAEVGVTRGHTRVRAPFVDLWVPH
jgi:hypothetical protein